MLFITLCSGYILSSKQWVSSCFHIIMFDDEQEIYALCDFV